MSNKGSVRWIADLRNSQDANWGSEHNNCQRGLPDAALDQLEVEVAKVAALCVAGKDKGGPFSAALQKIEIRNDGKGIDTGRHVFVGLTRGTIKKVNHEVIRILQWLAKEADQKS